MKKKIQKLISEGDIEKAINELLLITNFEDSRIVLLSGQFQQFKQNDLLGIKNDEYSLARIVNAVLELLDNILSTTSNVKEPTDFVIKRKKNLFTQILQDYELLAKLERELTLISNIKEKERIKLDIDEIKNLITERENEYSALI